MGVTLAGWGRQGRLLNSLRRLATGAPVKSVVEAGGYASASAFVAAFHATFGRTPARYIAPTAET